MRGYVRLCVGVEYYVVTDTETSVIVRSAASVEPDTTLTNCAPAKTVGSSATYREAATVTEYWVPSLYTLLYVDPSTDAWKVKDVPVSVDGVTNATKLPRPFRSRAELVVPLDSIVTVDVLNAEKEDMMLWSLV